MVEDKSDLTSIEYLIPHKRTLKILYKFKHFPSRYKRERKGVFLSDVQTKETPTRIFFLYLGGKCFDLHKIFWGMFTSDYVICGHKNYIFFATGDVILTSYLQVYE